MKLIPKATTRFGIFRHAVTVWNLEKRIQGQNDIGLAPEGKRRAIRWSWDLQNYHWDRILVSSARRAQETADIVGSFLKLPVTMDSRLQEQDWGRWTGKTIKQLKREEARELDIQEDAGWGFCPPGGEDRNAVWERAHQALDEAIAKWSGQRILVISHQGTIKCLLYRLLNIQFSRSEPEFIKPHALHWLIHKGEGLHVERYNALEFE